MFTLIAYTLFQIFSVTGTPAKGVATNGGSGGWSGGIVATKGGSGGWSGGIVATNGGSGGWSGGIVAPTK